jgi:hypothetical protein
MGREDLFRLGGGHIDFRGTMMISNVPLIPRQQHWARATDPEREQRC